MASTRLPVSTSGSSQGDTVMLEKCCVCEQASIELWRTIPCGHRACSGCLFSQKHSPQCPVCRQDCFVRCPGFQFGCQFDTCIPSCKEHLRTCPWRPTRCPYECPTVVPNKLLPAHLKDDCMFRLGECRFCAGSYFVPEIPKHEESCDEAQVTCAYCCKSGIKRGNLREHGASCRLTPKPCPLGTLGCFYNAPDAEMEQHLTLKDHVVGVREMKAEIQGLELEQRRAKQDIQDRDQEISELTADVRYLKEQFRLLTSVQRSA